MRKSLLWVSTKPVVTNVDILKTLVIMFKPTMIFDVDDNELPDTSGDMTHFIVTMKNKADTLAMMAGNRDNQDMDEYATHVREIREMAREYDSKAVVIDAESCPPPMLEWMFMHNDDSLMHERLPVHLYWRNKLYCVAFIDMDEDAE